MSRDDMPLFHNGLHEVAIAFSENAADVENRCDIDVGKHVKQPPRTGLGAIFGPGLGLRVVNAGPQWISHRPNPRSGIVGPALQHHTHRCCNRSINRPPLGP